MSWTFEHGVCDSMYHATNGNCVLHMTCKYPEEAANSTSEVRSGDISGLG